LATGAVAAAMTLGTLVVTAAPASAHVVCNRWGHCWNTHRYYYPAYYGGPYYDPYYDYDDYYGPYYGRPYYGPGYGYYGYGPSVAFGFNFGGVHHWHHHH